VAQDLSHAQVQTAKSRSDAGQDPVTGGHHEGIENQIAAHQKQLFFVQLEHISLLVLSYPSSALSSQGLKFKIRANVQVRRKHKANPSKETT
jgi:hypothetical protein